MESFTQIFEFLNDPKENVRTIAIEYIAGLSSNKDAQNELINAPHLLSLLCTKIHDTLPIATLTWKCLINLGQNRAICSSLISQHSPCIVQAIELVRDVKTVNGDLACMFLSNIAKADEGKQLLLCELNSLLSILKNGRGHNPNGDYDFLASVVADITTISQGRDYFLVDMQSNFFTHLLPLLSSTRVIRRGGGLTAIKNCLFEVDRHGEIFACDEEEEKLLCGLVGLLVDSRSAFTEEELDNMPLEISLESRHYPSEPDLVLRTLALESLLLLGSTLEGRKVLRAKKIYPILREWHRLESDETVKELVEKLVEYIIRDEE